MIAFLDTSALVKLYHLEEGTGAVENAISIAEELYLSEIARLEFRSALWKKVRTGEVSEENALISIGSFQNDTDNYRWVAVRLSIIDSAQKLLMTHGKKGLRTLDSIQLASVLTLRDDGCQFITFDTTLKGISLAENLSVA